MRTIVAIAAACAALAACGPKPITAAEAANLSPSDARLARLYEGSCKTCHTNPDAAAPLTHDARAWAPRWEQGEEVLLLHVVQGYKGMPAMGQCMTCGPRDLQALVRFMADKETAK